MRQKAKEDPSYLPKLEREISRKYGKETIEHPLKNWDDKKEKEYLEQLKSEAKQERHRDKNENKIDAGGFYLPERLFITSDRVCEKCGEYSFKAIDDVYMIKYFMCYKCFIKYKEWEIQNNEINKRDT